jgi:peroxiredoxin
MTAARLIRAASAAALLLALAACAPAAPASTEPAAAPVAEPAAESPSAGNAGDPIAFTAIDVETGEVVDGSILRGKDTILWFWASWCPVCEAESGAIVNAMAEPDWPDDVTVIGVAGLSDADQARVFIDSHGVGGFAHVYDTDGSIWQSFGVTGQPAFAWIDDDGTLTVKQGGIGKWDVLKKAQELAAS